MGRTRELRLGRLRAAMGAAMVFRRWTLGMESRWRPSVLILGDALLEAVEALRMIGRDDG
jgi:hypothetical protein